jgi:hypothetical protein
VEQVRSNRWLLTLKDTNEAIILALVQQRPLVSSADVQDLAELLHLRRSDRGILLALGGRFSSDAQRTAHELRQKQIHLCTSLPANPAIPHMQPALGAI